jgi:hypothetical protein
MNGIIFDTLEEAQTYSQNAAIGDSMGANTLYMYAIVELDDGRFGVVTGEGEELTVATSEG